MSYLMEFTIVAIESLFATLDRAASEDVAQLVMAELTPVPPKVQKRRSVSARGNPPLTKAHVVPVELTSPGGAAQVTKRELTRAIAAALEKRFGRGDVVVVREGRLLADPVMRKIIERLPSLIEARRKELTDKNIEALVDAFLPADEVASVMPDIEADNARAQANFLRTYPTLTAEEVAERAGHSAANRSATATRWKAEHKIFGVRANGREVYPAFQFKEGQPIPSLRATLKVLSCRSGWQTAFWFITPNSWLGGPMPIEQLENSEALAAAASHEVEEWIG